MQQLGYIQFRTHTCTVYKDREGDHILLFKTSGRRCDWDIFTDQESAAEYALEPFPTIGYRFVSPDD